MRFTLNYRMLLAAVAVIAVSFLASLKLMNWLAPPAAAPQVAVTPPQPLPASTRSSIIVAPVSISLSAIREAAERSTPRNFAGKAENPIAQILENADIGWTASRGPISTTGAQDALSLTTPLTGKLNVTGSVSAKATGAVGEALGSLLGSSAAKQIGAINIKNLNANAEIRGNVVITARPRLGARWRIEPNLAGQVNLGDTNLSVAGARINVPAQIKPLLDRTLGEQLNAISERFRNDRTLREQAKIQWDKACRSIPLQGAEGPASLPPLWLELKPVRAIAAQPLIDASALTLALGMEAETRVSPTPSRPDCPFPDKLSIVPPTGTGVSIAVPIDLPFGELNRIVAAELVGHSYPEDGSGPVALSVKSVAIVPAGARLLISLLVDAREKKSFFGLGAEATVHIWGRPMLDESQQVMRLADVELAVESEAAFGLLGAAARAAVPHLQKALIEKATLDLKPITQNAQKKIAAAIAEYQKNGDGIRVQASIDNVRLADLAFDANILRVIAEASGTLNVSVTRLPGF